MIDVLFAPHNDDETLFASYTLLGVKPHVIVVLDCGPRRQLETNAALEVLGINPYGHLTSSYLTAPGYEQWDFDEKAPDWVAVRDQMQTLFGTVRHVFAPAFEQDGHEHHNEVAVAALQVFGPRIVTGYLTYTRTGGRSTNGAEVIPDPGWETKKLLAMHCYSSQIARPETRSWFDGADIREWVQ